MPRSFDPVRWHLPIIAACDDLLVGEHSVREAARRRKVAFYLGVDGEATCQSLCPVTAQFPALVAHVTAAHRSDARVTLHVDAHLPLAAMLVDVAVVGYALCGATMLDVTVVDLGGHRRTVHAELPPNVAVTSPIVLALGWANAAQRDSAEGALTSTR